MIWRVTYFCLKSEESRANNFAFAIIEGIYNLKHKIHLSQMNETKVIMQFHKKLACLYRVIFQKLKHFLHIVVIHSSTNQCMPISLDEKYGYLHG